jgi:ribosomal-protein-alanine N-acetyltransferase
MLKINFTKFPALETERLLLRKMTMDDSSFLFELRTNDLVNRYTDRPKMKNLDEAKEKMKTIISMCENNEGVAWAIEMKENKKQVGDISFWRIIKEHHRAEIGYSSLPDYWGKGLMAEAMRRVIAYGFSVLKFHSIEANVNPLNLSSIKLLERTGFVREAYFRENYFFNEKFLDSAIYSLINTAS